MCRWEPKSHIGSGAREDHRAQFTDTRVAPRKVVDARVAPRLVVDARVAPRLVVETRVAPRRAGGKIHNGGKRW